MKKYLIIALTATLAALFFSVRSCQRISRERDRLSDNQRTLIDKATYYRTKDSLSAAGIERLTLTKRELENYNADLVKTCEDLRIKVRRLQSASTTATETKYDVHVALKDSIIVRDSLIIDTIPCVSFKDPYLTFSGCIDSGQFNGVIESRDTLVQIVHRIPRRFLFIKYGTKAIRQEIISKNPHSNIVYTEYIELRKKKSD